MAPAGNEAAFKKKYKLDEEQFDYIEKYAGKHNLSLEDAAAQIALEESGEAA